MAGRRSGVKIETNKAKEAKSIIKKHNKTFGGTLSNEETWTLAGISKMTFYKYKNELLKTEENS
jgi:DNA invertase Pin-like site-specific DNA recombinase